MEHHVMLMSAVLVAVLLSCASALPADDSVLQGSALGVNKRPKYMDTRDLDLFKFMLMAGIRDLVQEGELNTAVLGQGEDEEDQGVSGDLKTVAKRMRYMGICMRRRQNTFIPYPCLRSA